MLQFPNALLGEVGLDRAFRHSLTPYPSPPPRVLTPFVTPLKHQLKILEAQLALAVELRRNVSVHSVQAQQLTVELLERMAKQYGQKWLDISICLHSCALSPESWVEVEVCGSYWNGNHTEGKRSENIPMFSYPSVSSSTPDLPITLPSSNDAHQLVY